MLKAMMLFCVPYIVEKIRHWPQYTGAVKNINTTNLLLVVGKYLQGLEIYL